MKLTVSTFVLLICTAALLSTTEGRPKSQKPGCRCRQQYPGPAIPAKKVLSLSVIPAGPNCKNEEIIATMKNAQTCLDPTKDWVISLKKEINKRNIKSQP
ncbi:growth-regulated alpha protein-like [Cyprinus carpio]|uniref:Chemokine interleukin-8-like domain-containing protein n=2 Tax=Cyprinus carpio TaxID=7962 RepID=A0A9J8CZI3_CYPCA|nr:growth-regulated alpha protein-like [Cyprinus carpio]